MKTMILQNKKGFVLPDLHLSSLPTGAVKELVNTLGIRIANGEYEVGKNIPMEPELVAEHGVSRTVVREAIKVISGKGLVRTARRYGTHVCNVDEWNLLDPDVIGWHATSSPRATKILADGSKFRLTIEPRAASLAAKNATEEQLEIILSAALATDAETEANDARLASSYAFHASVLDASDCIMLGQFRGFLYAIMTMANSVGPVRVAKNTKSASADSTKSYNSLATAIASGDSDLSEHLMHTIFTNEILPASANPTATVSSVN